MTSEEELALIVDQQNQPQHGAGSEVMLTVLSGTGTGTGTTTNASKYDCINEREKILRPGDEVMRRDEVPLYPTYIYILYYVLMFASPFLLGYLSVEYLDDNQIEYIVAMLFGAILIFVTGWFNGAVFFNLCGLPSNYTRKIMHFSHYVFILLFVGGVGAFSNVTVDVLWATWLSQIWHFIMTRPNRICSNWCCGDTRSTNPCRWCNCCENIMDGVERKEDRPNHLLWLNTHILLYYIILLALSFWWNELESQACILIPAFICGFGDGLAEPVGVKFGRNGCGTGKDCTYKTHGCCTKYDYVRSVPGSSMVLLSGYLGVGFAFNGYTRWQFIIAMIIVPPLGCIVEAKAPHSMDNPFIALIVGVVATAILYIPY